MLDLYTPANAATRASARHRVPARRRLVGRHAHDRPGLPALLRAGRIRDGVDRVPAHARDHVPVECRGREDGRAVAARERRRASARSESHLPLGHLRGRSPGGGRGARAEGHVRGRGQPHPVERGAVRARRVRPHEVRRDGCPDRATEAADAAAAGAGAPERVAAARRARVGRRRPRRRRAAARLARRRRSPGSSARRFRPCPIACARPARSPTCGPERRRS